jgi:hypothetical protein
LFGPCGFSQGPSLYTQFSTLDHVTVVKVQGKGWGKQCKIGENLKYKNKNSE